MFLYRGVRYVSSSVVLTFADCIFENVRQMGVTKCCEVEVQVEEEGEFDVRLVRMDIIIIKYLVVLYWINLSCCFSH